jgi:hypothetical protein
MNDCFERLSVAAENLGLDLTMDEFLVAAIALTRVECDGEAETSVVMWAQRELGLTPAIALERLADAGASVRAIEAATGISKSRAQRLLAEGRRAHSPLAA